MTDSLADSGMAQLLLPNFLLGQSSFRNASLDELMLAAQKHSQQLLQPPETSTSPGQTSPYSIDNLLHARQTTAGLMSASGHQMQPSQTSSTVPSPAPPLPTNTSADDDGANNCPGQCGVCNDEASGRHYGVQACFGCKGFFRRTVRANKVYTCRYEERCQIDKAGRNVCRACRFRKCLEVGMEPDAIRPDRDKTGRQKNPRRSHNSLSECRGTQDLQLPNIDRDDRSSVSTSNGSAIGDPMPSGKPLDPEMERLEAERDLVLSTLREIERICSSLRDVDPLQASSFHGRGDLLDVISNPALVAAHTPLNFTGEREMKNYDDYAEGMRRLVVLAIDYANTMKPIADINAVEKIALIRSFVSSFCVFVTMYHSVQDSENRILLPNGVYVGEGTPSRLFSQHIDDKLARSVEHRIEHARSSMTEMLQQSMRRLQLSFTEFVLLKAILTLDPHAVHISQSTAQMLTTARESVQSALYSHLTQHYTPTEAVARFGKLLMLLSNISKVGALITNIMQIGREFERPCAFPATPENSSSIVTRLFTNDEPLVCAL